MLVDDHIVLRQGLRAFLNDDGRFEIIAEADNGLNAIQLAQSYLPDVVVMDVGMPDMNGVEATRQLHRIDPCIKVIALSMHDDTQYVKGIFDAGGKGYVLKTCDSSEVVRAIEAVMRGRSYIASEVTHAVIGPASHNGSEHTGNCTGAPCPDVLTSKERQVLQLLAEGQCNKQIASKLVISVKTVETHRTKLMEKLGLHNVAILTRYAIRHGIVTADC